MRKKVVMRALAALAGGGVLAGASVASAAQQTVTCPSGTVGDANTVFISGSSAVEQMLQHLAYVLYEEGVAAQGITDGGAVDMSQVIKIVYQGSASCQGPNDIVVPQSDDTTPIYLDGSQGTPAKPLGALVTCSIPTTEQTFNVDIGASDVFPSTCGITIPAGAHDFYQGSAIQLMEFTVPSGSAQYSITQDAAYVVMGWGGQTPYQVGPWTDPTQIWVRTSNPLSGTEGMVAAAIGLVPSKWLATLGDAGATQFQQTSGGVRTHLQTSTSPAAAIGILSAPNVDPNKGAAVLNDAGVVTAGGLRPLAFQAADQDCAYYADSTVSTFDKINVRQGRYAIWGAHHWITNIAAGDASPPAPLGVNGNNAAVAAVIARVTHESSISEAVDQAMVQAEAQTGDVPLCAMQVSRSAEVSTAGSGEMSFQPAKGCGCYFESVVGATLSSYCQPCGEADAAACPTAYPKCNYGFCEVQ